MYIYITSYIYIYTWYMYNVHMFFSRKHGKNIPGACWCSWLFFTVAFPDTDEVIIPSPTFAMFEQAAESEGLVIRRPNFTKETPGRKVRVPWAPKKICLQNGTYGTTEPLRYHPIPVVRSEFLQVRPFFGGSSHHFAANQRNETSQPFWICIVLGGCKVTSEPFMSHGFNSSQRKFRSLYFRMIQKRVEQRRE